MIRAIILGAWGIRVRNGESSNFPRLALDYPPSPDMLKCESTAQTAAHLPLDPPTLPNRWEVICSQSTLDELEINSNYWVESADIIEEI